MASGKFEVQLFFRVAVKLAPADGLSCECVRFRNGIALDRRFSRDFASEKLRNKITLRGRQGRALVLGEGLRSNAINLRLDYTIRRLTGIVFARRNNYFLPRAPTTSKGGSPRMARAQLIRLPSQSQEDMGQ